MKKQIKNDIPVIDENNYNISLAMLLNYYNNVYSPAQYKNAVIDYASSLNIEIPRSIPEVEFRSIGGACAILLSGQQLSIKHTQQVIDKINILSNTIRPKKEEVASETPKVVVDDDTPKFISWLEDSIDSIILGKSKEIPNLANKYASFAFNKTESRKISTKLEKILKTYNKDFADFELDDVKEAYSSITKTSLKKLITQISEFKDSISRLEVSTKPKKEKPASVQVVNMQYLKSYNNIVGLHPKEIIGKSVVYIFDTNTRDLICLHSIAGKFKAAGSTILNLDEAKCTKKKLRNETEVLNQIASLLDKTKKSYKELFDEIKTKEQRATGRLSADRIILKVF